MTREAGEGERVRAVLAALDTAPADVDDWRLTQLAGGWSRHTWVLSSRSEDHPRYVVRVKPPSGLLSSDLEREYLLYRSLEPLAVPAPATRGIVPDPDTPLGGPFFVMDWVPGDAPNVWARGDRERLEAAWGDGPDLARQFVAILAEIHSRAVDDVRFLGPVEPFPAVVERWRSTWEDMRLVRDPIVEEAFRWVLDRPPPSPHLGLVHGDYRIGNMLVAQGRITAVLDWELAYVGDTDFDLGYLSLDYVAGKFLERGSALANAVADREWLYAEYERLRGRPVDREVVRTYSALGALMLITILCTGARMYHDGKTADPRMAWNRYAIPGLRQDLTRLMAW